MQGQEAELDYEVEDVYDVGAGHFDAEEFSKTITHMFTTRYRLTDEILEDE